jgi:hypothetical protein
MHYLQRTYFNSGTMKHWNQTWHNTDTSTLIITLKKDIT